MKHAKATVKRVLLIGGAVLAVGTIVKGGFDAHKYWGWFNWGNGEVEPTPDPEPTPDTPVTPESEDSGNQKDNVKTYGKYSEILAAGAKEYANEKKTDYADKLAKVEDWYATAVYLYDDNSAQVSMFSGDFEQWAKVTLSLQSPYKGAKTIGGLCYNEDGSVINITDDADLEAIRATKNYYVTETEFTSKELNQIPFAVANAYTTDNKEVRTGVLSLSNIEKDDTRCEVEFDTVDWKGDTVYAVNTTTISANIAPIQAYAEEHKVSFEQAAADMITLDKQVGLTLQDRKALNAVYLTDKSPATVMTVDYTPSL
ncbi:MAG: hypothetical protein IK070_01130 [Clostridia bacterium]|nr:hypothetical protein [Clostridia bacterium]